ncbi:hypothetical protein HYPSUDRAFT_94813, partial [Hypholoma sublateritium FD-334 SS-4]
WAPIGKQAQRHDYFVRGQQYSILPTISLDGVLHLDILTRSWTAEEFRSYMDILLDKMNPYPQRNSVLILDNASAHHFDGLREIGFSAMKAWIRGNRNYILVELSGEETCNPHEMLWSAVFESMIPDNIAGWYRDSGYVA